MAMLMTRSRCCFLEPGRMMVAYAVGLKNGVIVFIELNPIILVCAIQRDFFLGILQLKGFLKGRWATQPRASLPGQGGPGSWYHD